MLNLMRSYNALVDTVRRSGHPVSLSLSLSLSLSHIESKRIGVDIDFLFCSRVERAFHLCAPAMRVFRSNPDSRDSNYVIFMMCLCDAAFAQER